MKKGAREAAKGLEIVFGLTDCFTLTHVSGRLSLSECIPKRPGLFPPVTAVRRCLPVESDSACLWKASMHTIAWEGEGVFEGGG